MEEVKRHLRKSINPGATWLKISQSDRLDVRKYIPFPKLAHICQIQSIYKIYKKMDHN